MGLTLGSPSLNSFVRLRGVFRRHLRGYFQQPVPSLRSALYSVANSLWIPSIWFERVLRLTKPSTPKTRSGGNLRVRHQEMIE